MEVERLVEEEEDNYDHSEEESERQARSVVSVVLYYAPLLVVAMFLIAALAEGGPGRRSSVTALDASYTIRSDDDGVTDPDGMSTRKAYDLLAGNTTGKFELNCSGVSFGYCGEATCRINSDGTTASCGCEFIEDETVNFVVSLQQAYLIFSKHIRKALAHWDSSSDYICPMLRDSSIYVEAGMNATLSSWPNLNGLRSNVVNFNTTSSKKCDDDDYNFADCHGAPCSKTFFNDKYSVTCQCPMLTGKYESVTTKKWLKSETAVSCDEFLSETECALQSTLRSEMLISSYEDAESLRDSMATAVDGSAQRFGEGICPEKSEK